MLGGTGGGAVNVNVSGYVGATGAASPSIYAQSSQNGGRSTSGAPVTININQNATISGGADYYHGGDGTAAGIQIFDGYYNANGPAKRAVQRGKRQWHRHVSGWGQQFGYLQLRRNHLRS